MVNFLRLELFPWMAVFFFFLAGSQELLDSWLTLVSRLSNSETLMDSPHSLPQTSTATGFVPFHPINFLVATQKVHCTYNYFLEHLYVKLPAQVCRKIMRELLASHYGFICSKNEKKFIQLRLIIFIQVYHKLVYCLNFLPCPSRLSPSLLSSFCSLYSSLLHSFPLSSYICAYLST